MDESKNYLYTVGISASRLEFDNFQGDWEEIADRALLYKFNHDLLQKYARTFVEDHMVQRRMSLIIMDEEEFYKVLEQKALNLMARFGRTLEDYQSAKTNP